MKSSTLFDAVEDQPKVKKKEFKAVEPELRLDLVDLQQRMRKEKLPVIMVFAGVDGAGKHEMVNTLNAWLDPRGIVTHAYSEPSEAARQRPPFWRYWLDLPAEGQLGLYLSAWYSQPLVDRVRRRIDKEEFIGRLGEIEAFERTLADNGILLLKVWMHLNKKKQRKRLEKLSANPETEWQVKPGAWENWGLYDRFMEGSEMIVRHSEEAGSPWLLVNGKHKHARQLKVADGLREAVRARLESPPEPKGASPSVWNRKMKGKRGILKEMDLSKSLEKEDYKKRLKKLQRKLYQLQHQAQVAGISTVLVFEGQDAAGKGGSIRRLVQGLDAQQYQVIPIAAPTEEERAHHYLWRFWRHLPRQGRVTIFDRSWYGRVLVERVEGFAKPGEWQRAYREINEFEDQLVRHGTVLCKFWIQIDKDMQLQRFEERKKTPYKQWKITDEDWRNRERWDEYNQAVDDMVALTDRPAAPWVLVEGNDKAWARIKVLEAVCLHLERALKKHP